MTLKAAFAEIDISPTPPAAKVGWLVHKRGDRVLDPLLARVMVLESSNKTRLAIVSLDVLSAPWKLVCAIRAAAQYVGIPANHVMVAATHNHAGPAVTTIGAVERDDEYSAFLVKQVAACLGLAVERLRPARLAIGSGQEHRV